MSDTSVKYFDSTMVGAPTLSYNAGYLVNTLDACLVTGFGSVTLNALVISNNVATATVSAGHNFAMLGTNSPIGPVIQIDGATPNSLNEHWRLASVPNSTTFTFSTSGISDQTATGTITAKRAAAGWSKAFSGTNKAAYQQGGTAGRYLRVPHTADADTVTVTSYPTMSDVDTGSGLALSGTFFINNPSRTKVPAEWRLVADHQLFWLSVYFYHHPPYANNPIYSYGEYWKLMGAGNLLDYYVSGDPYAIVTPTDADTLPLSANYTKKNGTLATANTKSFLLSGAQWGVNSLGVYPSYPAPINGGLVAMLAFLIEENEPRMQLPGIYAPWQREQDVPDNTYNVLDAAGIPRTLLKMRMYQNSSYFGMALLDLSGPWRE